MYCSPPKTVPQVKMKQYNDARPHAVNAWINSDQRISSATNMFTHTCKQLGLEIPEDPRGFVTYWAGHQKKHGSVKGRASNSGAKGKISKGQARTALDHVLNWKRDGLTGPYRSVADLVQRCPAVREIINSTGASNRTLTRAMQRLCPTLCYKKLTVKAKLTVQHKQKRVVLCTQHEQVSDSTLETVVWIDAKTMYMNITDRYGWVDATEEDIFETNRAATRKSNLIKLKYYIAVNARLGAVKLVFYTGTTGMPAERDDKAYLVSSTSIQLWLLASNCICCCLLELHCPAAAAALQGLTLQPHYTVTLGQCCFC